MDKLPATISDVSQLPETLRDFYEESEGSYVLKLEGQLPEVQQKLREFRENNSVLQRELRDWKDRFAEVDVDEYRTLKNAQDQLLKGALVPKSEMEQTLQKKIRDNAEQYKQELEGLNAEKQRMQQRLENLLIETKVIKAVTDLATPHKGAMTDIIARAKEQIRLNTEGELESATDGLKVDPNSWASKLIADSPYLFAQSNGSGSSGSGRGQGAASNPWKKDSLHLGRQAEILRADPALAQQLMKEAGT